MMTARLSLASLFIGACSGAHMPPVPVPPSSPASAASSRPWQCSTPVGSVVVELPVAHGLPLVGVSATVLIGGARVTVACDAPNVAQVSEPSPSSAAASVP